MEDLTGKQFGPYQIESIVGQGSMATVYKAYQPNMDRFVAIKVLPRYYADNSTFKTRFYQEAHTLANLQNPHIIPIFDFGEFEGYVYLVMPLFLGGTLKDIMTGKPLSLELINKIILQVGEALDCAHAHNIIHRDIKPANILIDERSNFILADFGISRLEERSSILTQFGTSLGTPAYMAPEQGQGNPIDARTDVYAMGAMLYQMLTGKVPFEAPTREAVIIKHICERVVPPIELNSEISNGIDEITLKALAKKPVDRFTSAGQMASKLSEAIQNATAPKMVNWSSQEFNNVKTANQKVVDNPRKPSFIFGGFIGALAVLLCGIIVATTIFGDQIRNKQSLFNDGSQLSTQAPSFISNESPTESPTPSNQKSTFPPITVNAISITQVPSNMPTLSYDEFIKNYKVTKVSNNSGNGKEPLIAVDKQGIIHFVWKDSLNPNDAMSYFHRIIKPDGTWSQAQNISKEFSSPLGLKLILNPDKKVCAFFHNAFAPWDLTCFDGEIASQPYIFVQQNYGDVHAQYTLDGEITYIYQQYINYDLHSGFDQAIMSGGKTPYLPQYLSDSNGTLHVLWIEGDKTKSVFHRFSTDGGKSWSDIQKITGNTDIYLSLETARDASSDIYALIDTYSQGRLLGKWSANTGWQMTTIGVMPPNNRYKDMAIDNKGLIHIVWDSGEGVKYTHQIDGKTWSNPIILPIKYDDLYSDLNQGHEPLKIAIDLKDQVHLVWWVANNYKNEIFHLTIPQ